MAVDLGNGFMTKFEEEGETYVEYSYGARELRCNVRTGQLIED